MEKQNSVRRDTRIRPRWMGCGSEPVGLDTVWSLGGDERGRARGQSETFENFPRRIGRMNGRKDSQAMAAAGIRHGETVFSRGGSGTTLRLQDGTRVEMRTNSELKPFDDWTLVPSGTEGYAKAEVTIGGVDTNELSSKTMEAMRAPGLYFIGEVVDVTGWLGGFNFQWAWASGFVAGQTV